MPDYQKMYTTMFNAATDAMDALERLNVGQAEELLRRAQIDAEKTYLEDEEK